MNFDPQKVALAAGLLIGLIVLVNLGLWAYYRKSNPSESIKMLGKTARRARAPWEEEDANLKDLNTLANELRKSSGQTPSASQDDKSDNPDEKRLS